MSAVEHLTVNFLPTREGWTDHSFETGDEDLGKFLFNRKVRPPDVLRRVGW